VVKFFAAFWLTLCVLVGLVVAALLWPLVLGIGVLLLACGICELTSWATWTLWGEADEKRRNEEKRQQMEADLIRRRAWPEDLRYLR
jgi:hypothetical protein